MNNLTAIYYWDVLMNMDESCLFSIPVEAFEEEFGYDPRDEG